MARWQLMTFADSMNPDAKLTGKFSDDDRRFRLYCLTDMLIKAEADVRKHQRAFDAEVAAAKRQGQHVITAAAVKALAERRPAVEVAAL